MPEAAVAESTVREYVRERRRQMGLLVQDTFVPQSPDWGHEAQVDWYKAWVDLAGERTRVQVFAIRAMASGAAFHRAYLHATQQVFLEAHEAAFAYFGGVFRLLRYDNLKSAVSKILRGHRREETARFVAFRSHWRFAAEFCTPGKGHEKGGVEGEGGYFRRNHLVPVPDVPDLEAVNALLLAGCRDDEARVLDGRTLSVGSAMATERDHLVPCVTEGFDLADVAFPMVDKQGCVAVRTNHYSVPSRAGTRIEARIYPTRVDLWHGGCCSGLTQPPWGSRPPSETSAVQPRIGEALPHEQLHATWVRRFRLYPSQYAAPYFWLYFYVMADSAISPFFVPNVLIIVLCSWRNSSFLTEFYGFFGGGNRPLRGRKSAVAGEEIGCAGEEIGQLLTVITYVSELPIRPYRGRKSDVLQTVVRSFRTPLALRM